jgi:hypothetical protein
MLIQLVTIAPTMDTVQKRPKKLWRSNSIFNLCMYLPTTVLIRIVQKVRIAVLLKVFSRSADSCLIYVTILDVPCSGLACRAQEVYQIRRLEEDRYPVL